MITLLVTVTNYGTSTIKNCVLTVGNDKSYPLNMTVYAGQSVPERITIPYTMGSGIDTRMKVEYDDVLGLNDEEERSNARSSFRSLTEAGQRGQNIRERRGMPWSGCGIIRTLTAGTWWPPSPPTRG